MIDPLYRETLAAVGRVPYLSAGGPAGALLDHGGLCLGRVGRRRDGRVGGVGAQARLEVGYALLQVGDLLQQAGDDGVTRRAPGAAYLTHAFILPANTNQRLTCA